MTLSRRILAALALLTFALPASSQAGGSLYDQVVRVTRAVADSPHVRALPSGKSLYGRSIPGYIISDFSVDSDSKTRVFICSGQHGNELNPMRSVLALSCRLASGTEPDLLSKCIFIVLPMTNPDGAAAATRLSGGGYDLNRGWRSTASLESRHVDGLIDTWRPHLLIDVHEQTTPIPTGGSFIEVGHCLTAEQQAAMNSLASLVSAKSGLRLATCGPTADKQLFHRNYTCLGYGAFLLETAVEVPYPVKDRMYASAILELTRAVAEDSQLRSALSPAASGFTPSPVRSYLRLAVPQTAVSAHGAYMLLTVCVAYWLCVWLISANHGISCPKWSRRYLKCELEDSLPAGTITDRHNSIPITSRSWVRRRLRSRYRPQPQDGKQASADAHNSPKGVATFITPRYSRVNPVQSGYLHNSRRA